MLLTRALLRRCLRHCSSPPAHTVRLRCSAANMEAPTLIGEVPHRLDKYGGVIIDEGGLPEAAAFSSMMEGALTCWRAAGRRGIWLSVPLARAELIAPAVALGFAFHHAEPTHLMLTAWLPETPCSLPPNASHQVGVGAFVLNAEGAVLAVQEKSGPAAVPGFWKLPTGLVTQGEPLAEAAVREVFEETGAETEFVGVIGFRQAHGVAFTKDDLFFLCALRLKDPSRTALTPQPSEIAAAEWLPLEQFSAMPHIKDPSTVWGSLHQLCLQWAEGRYPVIQQRLLKVGFRDGEQVVFSVGIDSETTRSNL